MNSRFPLLTALTAALFAVGIGSADDAADALTPWTKGVRVRPVLGDAERHSIHSYFNTAPESPDGKWILLYTSTTPEGHEGEIWIVERATGQVTVLASKVVVEDAHRAACQQWLSGGRRVAYHDYRDGKWVVAVVDVASRKERVLAEGRQVCWGRPDADVVPIYGPHSNPGAHRDLELLNVETGAIQTALTAAAVRETYGKWITERFGDRPISIFFPILSPDRKKVVFKLATPSGGDFRSTQASDREGLFCYDLTASRLLWMSERWGHPAWHPDSRSLIDFDRKGQLFVRDAESGRMAEPAKLPAFPGSHPSFSPDGRLFTTDFQASAPNQPAGLWAVAVGSLEQGSHQLIHRFDNAHGSTSWRRSHPHPSFSPDGRRLYFNVSADRWTRLYVAEADGRE